MIFQNIIELIQDEYPQCGQGLITVKFNNAYKKFCHKTKLLKGSIKILSTDPGWVFDDYKASIDLSTLGIDYVRDLVFNNVDSCPITVPYSHKYNGNLLELWYEQPLIIQLNQYGQIMVDVDGNIVIDANGNNILFPTIFNLISMEIVKIPKRVSLLTDNTEIEDEDAETVILKVKEELALREKDYNKAQYLRGIYKDNELEAMRKGTEGKDGEPLKPDMIFY